MAEISGAGVTPAMRIAATGHQWWWEFSYGGVKTANELHIPLDTPIDLDLTSADVIHSFWVPELGPKMDMLPGVTNHLRLSARLARRPAAIQARCAHAERATLERRSRRARRLPREPQMTAVPLWVRLPATERVGWLRTVDHKAIGVMYIGMGVAFFAIGGLEALLLRAQLATPEERLLDPETFNQAFTVHGGTMILLAVVP